MTFDEKNNVIEVCLFESYLAKYFIEHPELFQPLIIKIINGMEQVVKNNQDNNMFNRMLFSTFSTLNEQHFGIHDIETLKKSNSIVVFDTFLKYFSERVMATPSILLPDIELQKTVCIPSLSALAFQSLFKSKRLGQEEFLLKMRPNYLFSHKNRGITEIDIEHESETQNLGILSNLDTPTDLKNYFSYSHSPSRQLYKPKEDSLMAEWLRKHYLPVISGTSGGIGKTVSKVSCFVFLTKEELRLLGILVASSTISLGHHSFFEVIRPLSFLTGSLQEQSNLLKFYEQAIPETIKSLSSYKLHIEKYNHLIQPCVFDNPKQDNSQMLSF